MFKRIPVLMYHSIGDKAAEAGAGLYCVSEAAFRQQMEYVRKVTTSQSHKVTSLITTFDDGDMSNYSIAYPILREMGLKAYFFIIGGWIGKAGYMGWKEIKELKDNGMIIGSHGMTHRILTTLNDNELDYELKESKKILEDGLKTPVTSLSIPRGFCNNKIIDEAVLAGYEEIFTSEERIAVRADWDIALFADIFNGKYSWRYKLESFVKSSSKRLLGDKNYDKLRTKVLR